MASTEIITERSFYIGIIFTSILYGVYLVLFFASTYFLTTGPGSRKDARFYVLYGVLLLIFVTFAHAEHAVFGQLMWIEHRDVVGGPAAFLVENISDWHNTLGSAASVAANSFGDALLLYRCYIIWSSSLWVVAFPFIIFIASNVMAIISVVESALPGADIFKGTPVNFGVPYVALTTGFQIIVTGLISGRLLMMYKQVRSVLSSESAKTYTSVVAILVESATPFAITGVAYLIAYQSGSPTTFAFAQVWSIFSAISPQLIILRVSMGRAWSQETISMVTSPSAIGSSRSHAYALNTLGSHIYATEGTQGSQTDVNTRPSKKSNHSLTV